jgi:hypothetical protein
MEPADTAVLVGARFNIRSRLVDAYGNEHSNPVTHTTGSTAVQVAPDGAVSTHSIGRAAIVVDAVTLTDTAWVSVVPQGTIGAFRPPANSAGSPAIVKWSTDGMDLTVLLSEAFSGAWEWSTHWAPDGSGLIIHKGTFSSRLYRLDLSGTLQQLIPNDLGIDSELWPHYSRDGNWVYFTAVIVPSNGGAEIWRVQSDGAGASRVGPATGGFETDTHPSPSPNGTQLVFLTDRPTLSPTGADLAILDLPSGVVTYLGINAATPRWSPVEDLIVYVDNGVIKTIRPDGTGETIISQASQSYLPGLDWSPDGRWIIATVRDHLDIIEVQTGLTLPLQFARGLRFPAWKR